MHRLQHQITWTEFISLTESSKKGEKSEVSFLKKRVLFPERGPLSPVRRLTCRVDLKLCHVRQKHPPLTAYTTHTVIYVLCYDSDQCFQYGKAERPHLKLNNFNKMNKMWSQLLFFSHTVEPHGDSPVKTCSAHAHISIIHITDPQSSLSPYPGPSPGHVERVEQCGGHTFLYKILSEVSKEVCR